MKLIEKYVPYKLSAAFKYYFLLPSDQNLTFKKQTAIFTRQIVEPHPTHKSSDSQTQVAVKRWRQMLK